MIQEALDGNQEECPAEDSTIRRWIHTFGKALSNLESALISIWMQEKGTPWNLLKRISLLEKIKQLYPKNWLAFVNQRLLRFGFGIYTQFAFCPEPIHDTLTSKHKRKGQAP